MAKSANKKKKRSAGGFRRRERRFATSPAFMPTVIAIVGFVGAAVLGAGVFGLWILDPPLTWASYLVAGGGFLLGVSLWFGQAPETAVTVGDSGIAVEDGREMQRVPWHQMRSLRVVGANMVVEGKSGKVKFLLGANRHAAAEALKQAAERVPDIVDVGKSIVESLPKPGEVEGIQQDIEDDQVTGLKCAASDKTIKVEEDARLCSKCGQLYHKDAVPERCLACETELSGKLLRA